MQSTLETPKKAHVYHLQGGDFHITYSAGGSLDYKDGKKSLHFDGNQVKVLDSDIGQQVSVVIDHATDTSNLFALLLPNGPSDSPDITAVGIKTSVILGSSRVISYTLLTGKSS